MFLLVMALRIHTGLVVDPHKSKEKFEHWKKEKKSFDGLSESNREILNQYIEDMEKGKNTNGNNRGSRSYPRLYTLCSRLPRIARWFSKYYKKDLVELERDNVTDFFDKLMKGKIKKEDGKPYSSWDDYQKDFVSFWHWHMKVQKRLYDETDGKKGAIIADITDDLARENTPPPKFVYFTLEELQRMMDEAKFYYKVLMLFMFDSIIRSPTELSNIRVSDITPILNSDKLHLNIRDEVSKTYGRKIKLMLSHKLVKRYIKEKKLKQDNFLFKISPRIVNQYLKRLGKRTIGKEPTMYDFRHSGICYWMPRYKHETALRYRSGHKDSRMLDYYSQFLGMKDTIQEEDLEDVETRTQLQKELETEKSKRELLDEKLAKTEELYNKQIAEIENRLNKLYKIFPTRKH